MTGETGKVVWITGGSAGIGLAVARALRDGGCRVVISGRDPEALAKACDGLDGARGIVCDVVDRAAVRAAVADILGSEGRIDVLVNNAGFNSRKRKWDELLPEEFDAVIAANLTGTFNCIHAVLPSMRAGGGGLVVNMSSVAGKQVNPDGGVAYTIAKHGAHIMARMLNQTELKHGIRACVIAPAGVATRAHDWRPAEARAFMLDPAEVARAVRYAVDSPPHSAIFEIELSWSPV